MTQKEALQLRGRLQFAQGKSKLLASVKERGRVRQVPECCPTEAVSCRTFMILTDAEKETRTGGLGGVLLTGSTLSYFSVLISEFQADALSAHEEPSSTSWKC